MTPPKDEQSPIIIQTLQKTIAENNICSPDSNKSTGTNETSEHFGSMEDMITSEESNVVLLLTITMRIVPQLLGSEGIKKSKSGKY